LSTKPKTHNEDKYQNNIANKMNGHETKEDLVMVGWMKR